MNKKILIGSIIAVVILLLPSTIAMPESNSEKVGLIETQNTGNEEKPDLVISDIYPYIGGDLPIPTDTVCVVKNIGDAPAVGSIDVRLTVKKLFVGIIPIRTLYDKVQSRDTNGLNPGGKMEFEFSYLPPNFGFCRFNSKVDVYNRIDESDDDNNGYSATYFIFDSESMFGWGWWHLY